MMFKKKSTIVVAAIGVGIIIFLVWFLLVRSGGEEVEPGVRPTPRPHLSPIVGSPTPTTTLPTIPTSDTMQISGVVVKNIFRDAVDINNAGTVLVAREKQYQLSYYPADSRFILNILGSPFAVARREGEQAILRLLGVSDKDICRLNIEVTTPYFANPNEAGSRLNLSFCYHEP